MRSRKVQWLSLMVVVVLAAGLRLYDLKNLPAGLFCDEAALGYNGYSLATAGIDEQGQHFPLYVWSFGVSYKNPVYIYATALVVKVLGLDEFTTRLPAALFGIGTVIGIFFLGRALIGPWVGLFAALFLAICPWHLHFSRIAFELISFPFLFVIGCTLLVRFSQGRRTLPAAMFFLGSCIYAYAIANLFIPLFLLGFGLLYLPVLFRHWRQSLLAAIVLGLTIAPAVGFFYQRQRMGGQYFKNTTYLKLSEDPRPQLQRFARNYQQFFSPDFLFRHGDPIVRHAVRGHGELLPFFAPFLLLGAVVLLLRRDRPSKLILWWLVLYPVGASLMTEIPSATRSIIGVPAFCLTTAVGFAAVLRALGWIARIRPLALAVQTVACAAALAVLGPQVGGYVKDYFVEYPKYSAPTYGGFQYGYRDVIHYMESQRANYDLLMLTAVEVNQPYIFPMFYNRVDPRQWGRRQQLGYMILDPSEYRRYSMNQRILYALRPQDLRYFTDYTIKRKIVAPGGQVTFVIAEVRERKHFLDQWLGLGLFPNAGGQGVFRDFVDVTNLRRGEYPGAFGPIRWRAIRQQFVRTDLNRFYAASDREHLGNPEWVCAYAATTVRIPRAQSVVLKVAGSDDRAEIWLNGRAVTRGPVMLSPEPRNLQVDLVDGPNLVLLKTCETIGGWWFTARITDKAGREIPDLRARPELSFRSVEVAGAEK